MAHNSGSKKNPKIKQNKQGEWHGDSEEKLLGAEKQKNYISNEVGGIHTSKPVSSYQPPLSSTHLQTLGQLGPFTTHLPKAHHLGAKGFRGTCKNHSRGETKYLAMTFIFCFVLYKKIFDEASKLLLLNLLCNIIPDRPSLSPSFDV